MMAKLMNETFEVIGKNKQGICIDSESSSSKTEAVKMAKKMFLGKEIFSVEVIDHVFSKFKN